MIYKTALFTLAIFFVGAIVFSQTQVGDDKEPFEQQIAYPTPSEERSWTWIEKVRDGVEMLKASPKLSYTYKAKKSNLKEKQVALAVLNTATGEVFEKRIWLLQQDIEAYSSTNATSIPVRVDNSYNPLYPVEAQIEWWNSYNSSYSLRPRNYVVVANKYLMPSSLVPETKERSSDYYTDIIYVPYSRYLHQEELVEIGRQYLGGAVDRAFRELEHDGVKSKANPGKTVAEVVSKELVKNIVLIEHMDPDLLQLSFDNGLSLAERVLVIVGTNKDRAYYYTSSNASARGISQFIRSTYSAMVKSYPQAGLIRDHRFGTSNHVNSIKAMVLLMDNNRARLASHLAKIDPGDEDYAMGAAYNGNPLWVEKSVARYGANWLTYQSRKRILKAETIGYLAKLKAVKELDLW